MKDYKIDKTALAAKINALPARSAWDKGVKLYAAGIIEACDDIYGDLPLMPQLLNGAKDWREYSESGCALIWHADICERLSPPSVQVRYRHGFYEPHEGWLHIQARALYQAARMIARVI